MKKCRIRLICGFAYLFFSYILPGSIHSNENSAGYSYVGVNRCKKCHNEKIMLNQYYIWVSSPHANAVNTLKTDKAKTIAIKMSVKDPINSLKCLKCHTTGGGKSEITKSEGVGCEACHGPGSKYSILSNHVDFNYRANGYVKAKKYGMYPTLGMEINLKNREKLCLYCHRKERPCWSINVNDIQKQKISIQVIDKLRKGDTNFSHRLRRY